jgi:hypothetical protein
MKDKILILMLMMAPMTLLGQNKDTQQQTIVNVKAATVSPIISMFPGKMSQFDILYISRTNNEATVTSLSYSITGGGKTITGDFLNTGSSFVAYIDLATGFADVVGLTKVSVTLKDNNNNVVVDGSFDITLADAY